MYEKLLIQLGLWSQRELRKIVEKRVISNVNAVTRILNASQYVQLAEDCNGTAYIDVIHLGKAVESSPKVIINNEVISLGFFGEIQQKDSRKLLNSFDATLTSRLSTYKLSEEESIVASQVL